MVKLVVNIFSTLLKGFEFYKKQKAAKYENFIAPAMKDFELVHQNYLDCFKEYEDMIEQEQNIEDVFKKVQRDVLYTAHMRAKSFEMYEFKEHELFGAFVNSLSHYFEIGYLISPTKDIEEQLAIRLGENNIITQKVHPKVMRINLKLHARSRYRENLERIYKQNITLSKKREIAIWLLHAYVDEIQKRYNEVLMQSESLKREFLK